MAGKLSDLEVGRGLFLIAHKFITAGMHWLPISGSALIIVTVQGELLVLKSP